MNKSLKGCAGADLSFGTVVYVRIVLETGLTNIERLPFLKQQKTAQISEASPSG